MKKKSATKTYIIDTNVLLSDPNSLFAFAENEVILPLTVIEEVDKNKKLPSEAGANARETARRLSDMIKLNPPGTLKTGLTLENGGTLKIVSLADIPDLEDMTKDWDATSKDNHILNLCFGLYQIAKKKKQTLPIFVTRDILLRVKCDFLGIPCEDYKKSSVAENPDRIFSGTSVVNVPPEVIQAFFEDRGTAENNTDFNCVIDSYLDHTLSPNEFVTLKGEDDEEDSSGAVVRYIGPGKPLKFVRENKKNGVFGLVTRNKEQHLAMDLLLDDNIKLVTIIGKAGGGKAQPLNAKILTPSGWTTMGNIAPGMKVIGKSGLPVSVLGVYPQGEKDIYEIEFSDGGKTRSCKEHLWETSNEQERWRKTSSVKSLETIMATEKGHDGRKNHSIPIVSEVVFESQPVPLDPYLLGALIGDGGMSVHGRVTFTNADEELLAKIVERLPDNVKMVKNNGSKYDYNFTKQFKSKDKHKLVLGIKELGLSTKRSHEKFIPNIYKYNDISIRKQILQGLVDTDGYVRNSGTSAEYYTTSHQLALDVKEIVEGLAGLATISQKQTKYTYLGEKKLGKPSWVVRMSFTTNFCPASLSRKASKWVEKTKYTLKRYITKITLVGKEQAQCIMVDSEDHLYVTDNHIVTHNTLCALAAGLSLVLEKKKYKNLVVCRPVVPVGNDIGFLPGDKNEKLEPWIAPIKDNLKYLLFSGRKTKQNEETLQNYFDNGIIEVEAITYLRGRSIADALIIIDEAQNLTAHELKTIITRVGDNTKIILTGDVEQIDAQYLDSVSNGLAIAVEKFKAYDIAGHITLQRGERSKLATLAANIL